jgi:histidine ammonia-lyase
MHFRRCRRLLAVLSAMLVTLSIVGHGFMLGDMGAKAMMVASVEMTAPDGTMDCDKSAGCDDMTGMHMACVAQCASLVAVLSDPAAMPVTATVRQVLSVATSVPASRNGPPDPYPPKPTVLI